MSFPLVFRDGGGREIARGSRRGDACRLHVHAVAAFRFRSRESRSPPEIAQSPPEIECHPLPGAAPDRVARALHHIARPLAWAASGRVVLHAAAVGSSSRSLVFCGPSGVGKSTMASALESRGWTLRADDAVALEPGEKGCRLSPDFLGGKVVGGQVAAVCTLDRKGGGDPLPELEELRGAEALTALLPHLHTFDPEHSAERRRLAAAVLEVAAATPIWRLRVGEGDTALTAAVDLVERRFGRVAS